MKAEEFQEKRYSCKFCNKICSSGRSLGGHMRCHLALISAEKDDKIMKMGLNLMVSDQSNGFLQGFEDGGQVTSYGLRDHPKKSWRVSDHPKHRILKQINHCEKCDKGFQSLGALKGHMRCHFKRESNENVCKECGKVFDSMKALFGHMRTHSKRSRAFYESVMSQSDFEAIVCPIRRKRSKIRYKIAPNHSFPNLNSSSSNIDSEEDMEMAMCLMMLSRGVKNWGTSDYNSLTFEAQSFYQSKGIGMNEGGNFGCDDGDETWKMGKIGEKLDYDISFSSNALTEKKISESDDFGPGFASIDEKKIELEVSIDGLSTGDMWKKPRHDDAYALELDDTFIEKGKNIDLEQHLVLEVNLDKPDLELMESNSSKKLTIDIHGFDLERNSSGKIKCSRTTDSEILKDSVKKHEYKCTTCDKIFHSHQALGGHRIHHKIISNRSVLNMANYDKIIETSLLYDIEADSKQVEEEIGVKSYESMKSKDYECPICFKVFPSGQALGGHKRAHYNGMSEGRAKENLAIQKELPDIGNIFGFNLSVALEEGAKSGIRSKPWGVGSHHGAESEALVISN